MEKKLGGVITAAVTPFKEDRSFDRDKLQLLLDYYLAADLDGVFVNSSSGEYYSMTGKQRRAVLTTAVKWRLQTANRDRPFWLLSGISADQLEQARENGRQAAQAGADVAVAMPPRFYKYSDDELVEFFFAIADAIPIPLLVYNHLVRLNNKLSIDCVLRLSEHPNIIGVKDTHNDANRLMTLLHRLQSKTDFAVFAGGDSVAGFSALLGGSQMNALSGIKPRLFLDLQRAGQNKDVERVTLLQQYVNDLMGLFAICYQPDNSMTAFTQGLKTALHLQNLCLPVTAQLGPAVTAAQTAAMVRFLAEFAEKTGY